MISAYPNATLMDEVQYRTQQTQQVNQLLDLVYTLLGLAVIIALIGIANTLALSIYERTRELGLLRAVGATRGQLRSMVRSEALIIAMFGAIEGLALGMLAGWAMVTAMHSLQRSPRSSDSDGAASAGPRSSAAGGGQLHRPDPAAAPAAPHPPARGPGGDAAALRRRHLSAGGTSRITCCA